MGELRKEMNEKLAKMIKEAKSSKRNQSIPKRKNHKQTRSRIETSHGNAQMIKTVKQTHLIPTVKKKKYRR